MDLYHALAFVATPFDIRFAVLRISHGYPFSTYIVIASNALNEYRMLDLGQQDFDIEVLLGYSPPHPLWKMEAVVARSKHWQIYTGQELIHYNRLLRR